MASDSDQQEKTEEATEQRRLDFRRRGQVAQTRELSTVLMLMAVALTMWLAGKFFLSNLADLLTISFSDLIGRAVAGESVAKALGYMLGKGLLVIAPLMILFMVISTMSSVLQIGFLTNEEALKPNLEKLNPLEGLKRIFSLRAVVEGLKAVLKVTLVGGVVYLLLEKDVLRMPQLVHYDISQLFAFIGDSVLRLLFAVAGLMVLLSGFDYFFQRWDLEKKMRMTKQEVKEEHKSREGDPLIKARIRRIQREMARRRMMEAVKEADVVITNPTHIAVALKYDPTKYPAPILVAKGADAIAQKIKELAKEHGIPCVENKPLARTIFKTMKLGQVIPRDLFTAVAQVLSYVFRLKRKANA